MSTPQATTTIQLNEENAVKLLHGFVEQAQRGQAIKSLADAATLHRALVFLSKTSSGSTTDTADTQSPQFTVRQALNLCLQAVERGQGIGLYTLEEAHNAAAVFTYLVNTLDVEGRPADPSVADKGKAPAAATSSSSE